MFLATPKKKHVKYEEGKPLDIRFEFFSPDIVGSMILLATRLDEWELGKEYLISLQPTRED